MHASALRRVAEVRAVTATSDSFTPSKAANVHAQRFFSRLPERLDPELRPGLPVVLLQRHALVDCDFSLLARVVVRVAQAGRRGPRRVPAHLVACRQRLAVDLLRVFHRAAVAPPLAQQLLARRVRRGGLDVSR